MECLALFSVKKKKRWRKKITHLSSARFNINKIRSSRICLPVHYFDPLKWHFYIVKRGFTGVILDCGYLLEPPHRGSPNKYPQSMFWAETWKILDFFLSKNFHFLAVKFSVYLNRHVFVMAICFQPTTLILFLFIQLLWILIRNTLLMSIYSKHAKKHEKYLSEYPSLPLSCWIK